MKSAKISKNFLGGLQITIDKCTIPEILDNDFDKEVDIYMFIEDFLGMVTETEGDYIYYVEY